MTVGANSQKIDSLSKSFRRSVNYPDGERRQSLSDAGRGVKKPSYLINERRRPVEGPSVESDKGGETKTLT